MSLFGKGKKAESSADSSSDSIDADNSSTSNNSSNASNNSSNNINNNSGAGSMNLSSVFASIEKLNAESLANKEVRTASNDRFAKISGEIGELRTMLRNNEKTISAIEAKTERAVGLIDAVQPQALLSAVNKVDFKIEALKAKVEANELIYSKVRDDIRDLRSKFSIFRNLEMIKELNEDSKNRFRDLKKIEFEIIKHSDRVESMFNEIEKSIKDSKENTKVITDISESIKKLLIGVDKFKSDLNLRVTRDELRKVQESLDKGKSEMMDVVAKDMENYKRKLLKDIEVSVKQDEIKMVHQLVREDLKKSGINIETNNISAAPEVNNNTLKMLMYMNMELLIKDYGVDSSKLKNFKDNPYAFTIMAYFALRLKDKTVSEVKNELISMGFVDKNLDMILGNARLLEKKL